MLLHSYHFRDGHNHIVMVCNSNALINLSIAMMNLGHVLNTRLLAVLDTVSVNAYHDEPRSRVKH